MLGRLDAIEKAPVDDGLPDGGDRSEQERGAGGIGARHGVAPLPQPVLVDGGDGGTRDAVEEGRLIQQGMTIVAEVSMRRRDQNLRPKSADEQPRPVICSGSAGAERRSRARRLVNEAAKRQAHAGGQTRCRLDRAKRRRDPSGNRQL